jgi:hypothetical protein
MLQGWFSQYDVRSWICKNMFTYFHFIPHKREPNADINTVSSKTESEVSQYYSEMAVEYTFVENVDMHLVLSEYRGNSAAAVRQYAEKYPNRWIPKRKADQRIRETGTLCQIMVDGGHPRSLRTPVMEGNILAVVGADPSLSTRRVSGSITLFCITNIT